MPDRSLFRKTNLRFMFEVLSDWDPLEGIFCVFFRWLCGDFPCTFLTA